MSERSIIAERLRKKQQEIQALEEKLKTARIYANAFSDILNALDKSPSDSSAGAALKPGSSVAQAREVILDTGKPIHVDELLEVMGRAANRVNKASLTSSLAAYVRRGEIFTRPAPNTFGLVELGHDKVEADLDPPPGFGRGPAEEFPLDEEIPF